jgi:hypothetical protein
MPTVTQSRDEEAAPRRQLFGNRSTVTALVALCLAALLVTGCGQAATGVGSAPTATQTPSPVPTRSLPLTPSPTPTQFSPQVDYRLAWGLHAVTATYSMTIDATHTFIPTALSPDGLTLLGNEQIAPSNPGAAPNTYQAGYFNPATRIFTPIGVNQDGGEVECCSTDGRFIVAMDTDCLGCTGGPDHLRLWAYDLDTGRLRLVATGEADHGLLGDWFSNGFLVFNSGLGMEVANLAAGTVAPLGVTRATPVQYYVDDSSWFSWPYLIYELPAATAGQFSPIWLYNFQSGQDTQFSALQKFMESFAAQDGDSLLISGDTIYVTMTSGAIPTIDGVTTLYALDHVLSGGTGQRKLATYNGDIGCANGVDSRLIVCQPAVWDLARHLWVTFPDLEDQYRGGTPIDLGGNFLEVLQTTSSGGDRVLLFNTATLPTG